MNCYVFPLIRLSIRKASALFLVGKRAETIKFPLIRLSIRKASQELYVTLDANLKFPLIRLSIRKASSPRMEGAALNQGRFHVSINSTSHKKSLDYLSSNPHLHGCLFPLIRLLIRKASSLLGRLQRSDEMFPLIRLLIRKASSNCCWCPVPRAKFPLIRLLIRKASRRERRSEGTLVY